MKEFIKKYYVWAIMICYLVLITYKLANPTYIVTQELLYEYNELFKSAQALCEQSGQLIIDVSSTKVHATIECDNNIKITMQ